MFSGFEGEGLCERDDPANSSVTVALPITGMVTGWEVRFGHFMDEAFFDASADGAEPEMVTFRPKAIDATGDATAPITGDLTLNGIAREVVRDTVPNKAAEHPMQKRLSVGFDATTTLLRSDFGACAPMVSGEGGRSPSRRVGRTRRLDRAARRI